jgi:hypothetical protein
MRPFRLSSYISAPFDQVELSKGVRVHRMPCFAWSHLLARQHCHCHCHCHCHSASSLAPPWPSTLRATYLHLSARYLLVGELYHGPQYNWHSTAMLEAYDADQAHVQKMKSNHGHVWGNRGDDSSLRTDNKSAGSGSP